MKKAAGHISVILKGILCIGFSIQIVFGIVWMCFNFAHLQAFQQDSGILYRGLKGLVGNCFGFLYLLQLLFGFYAADRFLQKIHPVSSLWRIWGNLVLLTFPMAMQCHLVVAPYSFASSCVLLELSAAISAVRDKGGNTVREFARGGFFWLMQALLLPEYFVLGAVPLLLAFMYCTPALFRQLRKFMYTAILFLAFGGMIVGSYSLAGEKCLPDKETISFSLFGRMTWPTIWHDYEGWPDEVRAVTDGCIWEVSQYADNLQKIFRPLMQENFTDEQASEYYLQMAEISLKKHPGTIIRQMGGDILGYGVTPLILPMQLRGETYMAYSGRNYELMFMQSPLLTKYYVHYSCRWFAVMLVLSVLLFLTGQVMQSGRRVRGSVASVLLCLLTMGMIVIVYTMRGAGMMDYKYTVAVNLLWLTAALLLMRTNHVAGSLEGNVCEETERKHI